MKKLITANDIRAAHARGELNRCVTLSDFDRVLEDLLADRSRIEAEEAAYLAQGPERCCDPL